MQFVRWKSKTWHIDTADGSTTLCGRAVPPLHDVQHGSPPETGICSKCNRAMLGKNSDDSESQRLERAVLTDLQNCQLTDGMKPQHKVVPGRKYKADFAWPALRIMLDVNGGTYARGAHSRGPRQRNDYEKWSLASINGWIVLLVDARDVRAKIHIARVQDAIEARIRTNKENDQ